MNPHFWPDSFNVPRNTTENRPKTWRLPASVEAIRAEPSIARSEWILLTKSHDAQRTYLLVIKDRDGKVIESSTPEMLLDGDVLLNQVVNAGVGKWKVTLDFPKDQAVVQIGFNIGEYRLERFRRVHWQLHQVDRIMSTAFTNKLRVRSDGKDSARVYVHLRDTQDFPIYQFHDFDLRLKALLGNAQVEGPFATLSGPYFLVKGIKPGVVKLEAQLDGEHFGHSIHIEFTGSEKGRTPASADDSCLTGLAKFLKQESIPKSKLTDEYERLAEVMVDAFQMLITPSELQLQENLSALSSPSCTALAELDQLRESFSSRLRQMSLRANRTAQGKGNIHNMWNPHRTPQN